MSFVLANRVKETTTSPGTGTATLSGAVSGYQSFSAGIGANNTTYYTIADQSGTNWEVGYGTVGAGGTTLARTTVLASSNSGSLVNFASGTQNVWCDYPASKAVIQDTNGNASVNCLFEGFTSQAASGTTITLTAASPQNLLITGSGGQTVQLPNATTLPNGALFTFNNNQSSGAVTVVNASSTTIATIQSGGYVTIVLLSNSTSAGSWDRHDQTPSNVSWSTNTLDYGGSITSASWNGSTVAYNRGGTGQSSAFVAGGVVYGSTTSALAVTPIGTSGQVLTSQGAGTPIWTTPTTGTVTSVTGTSPVASSGGATPAISLSTGYGDTQNPYASKTANYILAAPSGSSGAPTFRAVTALDLGTGSATSSTYLRGDLTWATVSSGITVTNDTSTATALYPTFTSATSGSISGVSITSTKLTFVPSTGALSSTSVAGTSDERLKTNWKQIDPGFLDKLSAVKSGIYDRTDVELTQAGVSAQSLQEVLPEAVLDNGDGYLAVAYGNAALVAAIELAKEVKALRAEIEILKAK